MIEVKNLTKNYGSKLAVNDISFTVNDGEILGFLGPNGAGKSTTMNILTGYISATEGQALINGIDILDEPVKAKKHIGYLPEIPPLYPDMTVREYLNFVYDLKKCRLPRKAHIDEVCSLVKITDVAGRLIKHLSKGYKQRVGVAQALVGNPEILILDEPTVGLDPKQILDIRNLIKKLGKKHTVILSSHILSEIQAVADRIVIINQGVIAADDTAEHLSQVVTDDLRYTLRADAPEDELLKVVTSIKGVEKAESLGSKEANSVDIEIQVEEGTDIRRELFKRLSERGWAILLLESNEMTLEDVFLRITMGDQVNIKRSDKQSEENTELKKELFNVVNAAVGVVDSVPDDSADSDGESKKEEESEQ